MVDGHGPDGSFNIVTIRVVMGYERLDEMPLHEPVTEHIVLDELTNERRRAYGAASISRVPNQVRLLI